MRCRAMAGYSYINVILFTFSLVYVCQKVSVDNTIPRVSKKQDGPHNDEGINFS